MEVKQNSPHKTTGSKEGSHMGEKLNIERIIKEMDFSRSQKDVVWEKIRLRLDDGESLSLDELDAVAGGLAEPVFDSKQGK